MAEKRFKNEKLISRMANLLSLVVLAAMLVAGIYILVRNVCGETYAIFTDIINMTLDVFCMAICIILLLNIFSENEYNRQSNILVSLISYTGFNLFTDLVAWNVDCRPELVIINKMDNTLFYMFGSFIALWFWYYLEMNIPISDKMRKRCNTLVQIMFLLNAGLLLVNWFTGIVFSVDSSGMYKRSEWFPISYLSTIIMIIMAMFVLAYHKVPLSERLSYYSYIILPIISCIIQAIIYGISIMYPSTVLGIMLIYNNIHVKRRRKIIEQENEISQKNVAIMISQIQPHFLYNSLTTISNLCRKDPKQAEEATLMFSRYLRMNLDSIKKTEPVPFAQELEHVKIYLDLEKRRFEEKLNIEYDIEETNFKIPALSIQPIVENSVKHGICEKDEPGTLKISTKKTDNGFDIVIADDGVGFDTTVKKENDGRSHVGMNNVRDRLLGMSGAVMEIVSSPGNGCVTTIHVPEKH